MCIPFPIPKISSVLQETEGLIYANAVTLDLHMDYYTLRIDPDVQKMCMIILYRVGNCIYNSL